MMFYFSCPYLLDHKKYIIRVLQVLPASMAALSPLSSPVLTKLLIFMNCVFFKGELQGQVFFMLCHVERPGISFLQKRS